MEVARLAGIIMMAAAIALCARAVKGAELERLSMDVGSYYTMQDFFQPEYTTIRRPQMPYQQEAGQERWSYSLKLNMDLKITDTLLGKTYWNNRVTGASTTRQFRYVGYEFSFVHQFNKGLGVFYHHHSEHALDAEKKTYPLQDSFGVVLCLAGRTCVD